MKFQNYTYHDLFTLEPYTHLLIVIYMNSDKDKRESKVIIHTQKYFLLPLFHPLKNIFEIILYLIVSKPPIKMISCIFRV